MHFFGAKIKSQNANQQKYSESFAFIFMISLRIELRNKFEKKTSYAKNLWHRFQLNRISNMKANSLFVQRNIGIFSFSLTDVIEIEIQN